MSAALSSLGLYERSSRSPDLKWGSYLQNGERVHTPPRAAQEAQEVEGEEEETGPEGTGGTFPPAAPVRCPSPACPCPGAPGAHHPGDDDGAGAAAAGSNPGPNKITQQGPPFLPYDPWARQRRGIQRQEEQQLEQMTRIARERAQRQAHSEDGGPLDEDEFSIGGL